jgi:hypothetical protein
MGKDHDFGEAVCLQNVEKLESFHFETKITSTHKSDEIGNLGNVQL